MSSSAGRAGAERRGGDRGLPPTADRVDRREHGVERTSAGLGSALGLDALTVDDDYRAADVTAPMGRAVGAAAQRLVLAGAGAFPPTTATSPAGVAAAWAGLTALQQEAWIQLGPAVVGALDGLPTRPEIGRTASCWTAGSRTAEQMLGLAAAAGDTALVAEWNASSAGMVALQQTARRAGRRRRADARLPDGVRPHPGRPGGGGGRQPRHRHQRRGFRARHRQRPRLGARQRRPGRRRCCRPPAAPAPAESAAVMWLGYDAPGRGGRGGRRHRRDGRGGRVRGVPQRPADGAPWRRTCVGHRRAAQLRGAARRAGGRTASARPRSDSSSSGRPAPRSAVGRGHPDRRCRGRGGRLTGGGDDHVHRPDPVHRWQRTRGCRRYRPSASRPSPCPVRLPVPATSPRASSPAVLLAAVPGPGRRASATACRCRRSGMPRRTARTSPIRPRSRCWAG